MKNKPAKKFFESTNYSTKQCDEKGCNEEGNFIAPKSPNNNEKYFFCLKHIKIFASRESIITCLHLIMELCLGSALYFHLHFLRN